MIRRLRKMSGAGDETLAEWETETVSDARLQEIELEYNKLVAAGHRGANLGTDEITDKFDPNADNLLIPAMRGGSGSSR